MQMAHFMQYLVTKAETQYYKTQYTTSYSTHCEIP